MRKRGQKTLDNRQSLANDGGNSELLPIDLIIEILSRLPVKFIARCRCVSKLWYLTILRPEFTDLIMKRSATTQPQLLFACKTDSKIYLYSSPQPRNPNEESSSRAASYHMSFPLNFGDDVLNSVNGLICLKHNRRNVKGSEDTVLVICNPSTGQTLTLPRVKTRKIDVINFFGYDPVEKQFKVLSMTRPKYGRNTMVSEEHQILTLRNGKLSWRMIECGIPHDHVSEGISINGVLYYQAYVPGFEDKSVIACFDIRSEKFNFVKKENKVKSGNLVNYKGQLATLGSDNHGYNAVYVISTSFELCVLEDAQKHEWSTHTYVLPPLSRDIVGPCGVTIEGVTRTGEIVLSPRHQPHPFYFLYYNLERKTIRKVEVQGMDIYKYSGLRTFIDHVEDVKIGGVFQTS